MQNPEFILLITTLPLVMLCGRTLAPREGFMYAASVMKHHFYHQAGGGFQADSVAGALPTISRPEPWAALSNPTVVCPHILEQAEGDVAGSETLRGGICTFIMWREEDMLAKHP